jgi:hypothetical protein
MRYLSPAVPQGGTKDGWSPPAILIRFLKVHIFNIRMPPKDEGLDVGDRVRLELIRTDVEQGFIDFARAGGRQGD